MSLFSGKLECFSFQISLVTASDKHTSLFCIGYCLIASTSVWRHDTQYNDTGRNSNTKCFKVASMLPVVKLSVVMLNVLMFYVV